MKLMLIGRTGAGKTTLAQKLNEEKLDYKKTQMVNYIGNVIDTPGEYVENRAYYKALNVISVDANVIGFVQSSLEIESIFPPNFSSMFLNKKVIGIITKIELNNDTKIARELLKASGVEEIIEIKKDSGIDILKSYCGRKKES